MIAVGLKMSPPILNRTFDLLIINVLILDDSVLVDSAHIAAHIYTSHTHHIRLLSRRHNQQYEHDQAEYGVGVRHQSLLQETRQAV
jgi:hypothetical protein